MAMAAISALNLPCGAAADSTLMRTRKGTYRSRPCKFKCRAAQGSRSKQSYYGYDLYDLLGVENSAPQPEIKKAYRWLQKKCHPDVAGELGHDMSILLNEAYAILSDPASRSSYDMVRAEWIQFEGFTGEPLYSKWMGPACEEKAVFVDEVRCIGCLKCALIAPSTFAVEKRYGRARAVSQWGDSKPVIDDAIRACPVDCISWVDRSKLAALEYLMSKQPRYAVNIEPENSPGERTIDVFKSADKFLKKNTEFQSEKDNPARRYRAAATDAIQARAGRWWHFFVGKSYSSAEESDRARSSQGAIVPLAWFYSQAFRNALFTQGKLRALYEAVTQQRGSSRHPQTPAEEYWEPLKNVTNGFESPPASTKAVETKTPSQPRLVRESPTHRKLLYMRRAIPLATSLAAAFVVALQTVNSRIPQTATTVGEAPSNDLSALLQELTSYPAMQPVLAGISWYVITAVACGCLTFVATLFVDDTQV